MRAQIKANHVPETVLNFGGDSSIVPVFIVMNAGGCFLFQDPVYVLYVVIWIHIRFDWISYYICNTRVTYCYEVNYL